MNILAQEKNYLPIDIETKYHACSRRVVSSWSIKKVLSFYHVKRSSLYRRLKKFNGTKESLIDKSHKPLKKHPNSIDSDIVNKILNLHKRNSSQSFTEIRVRLKHDGINVSPSSVLRIFKRNNAFVAYKPNKKKHDKKYFTPKMVHEKWQIDVKYVPKECKAPGLDDKFYQYTILDECSRKRALYFTNEHSIYETVQAIKYAHEFFGCYPKEIQTDNGVEFTDKVHRKPNRKHSRKGPNFLENFCEIHNIFHHLIHPRTLEHNGKVERSHRIDQDKFYRYLRFYSLADLRKQGLAWNKRDNNLPKLVLNFKTPNEVELEKLKELLDTTGEIRCSKRLTSFES